MIIHRACSPHTECLIVWKCLMICLTVMISGHVPQVLASCGNCTQDLQGMAREKCSMEGQTLHDAEDSNNKTGVCEALPGLLLCLSTNVPECLEELGTHYKQLYATAEWKCTVSQKQDIKYREIATDRCSIVPVDVDVVSINDGSDDTTARVEYSKQGNGNSTTKDPNSSSRTGINVILTLVLAISPVFIVC